MRKILKSLLVIGVVAAVAFGATKAFFSDTEESKDNIFVAGSIDLKVDHARQTYNDVDCHTCSVLLVSDTTNMVVEKNGVSFPTPYPAVLAWEHERWTAEEDPSLAGTSADWIWESNPTKQEDTTVDTSYTFQKTFEWMGPVVDSDLVMGVGHDNTIRVLLNGVEIAYSNDEYGYQKEHMLHVSGAVIAANVVSGNNVLKFVVTNKGLSNGTPSTNPGGLIYKFEINGKCTDNYFKTYCKLWNEKDLVAGDTFYNFDDVKPGDHGSNLISLRVYDNDAYACMYAANLVDAEVGTMTEPETNPLEGNDTTSVDGELSKYLKFFAWKETDGDGVWEAGETSFVGPVAGDVFLASVNGLYLPTTPLPAGTTEYVGIVWCFGEMTVVDNTITCDGSTASYNDAQTDSVTANIGFYVEQARHNEGFTCDRSPTLTSTSTP